MSGFTMINTWKILLTRVGLLFLLTTVVIACDTDTLKTVTPPPTKASALDSDKYVGLVNPDAPNGYEKLGIYTVDPVNFEYYVVVLSQEDTRLLWLEKLTGSDAQGKQFWKVVAVLVLNDFRDNAINIGNCYVNDKPDPEIIAPSDYYQQGEIFKTDLKQAWRANKEGMKFEPISTAGIKCESLLHR